MGSSRTYNDREGTLLFWAPANFEFCLDRYATTLFCGSLREKSRLVFPLVVYVVSASERGSPSDKARFKGEAVEGRFLLGKEVLGRVVLENLSRIENEDAVRLEDRVQSMSGSQEN